MPSWSHRIQALELSKIFATAATTLFFGSLLGDIVTLLIAEFDRRRLKRVAQIDFIAKVLTDLNDVHDQVERGRTLIKAHRSAKTYGEEMRMLIQACIKLQNLVQALEIDERGELILGARKKLEHMKEYLGNCLRSMKKSTKLYPLSRASLRPEACAGSLPSLRG